MARILHYEVTKPPTSDEVEMLALEALKARELLTLKARTEPNAFDPEPAESEISFRIQVTRHSEGGGASIIGQTVAGATVNLALDSDPSAPAAFSLVVPE